MTTEQEEWAQAPVRTYRGYVLPGGDVSVLAEDGGGPRFLEPLKGTMGTFAWGHGGRLIGENILAMVILADALGSEDEARRYYQRFKHRTVALWTADSPWTITLPEIRAVVDDIKQVERETAGERAAVARQPMPVVNEGGGGVTRSPQDQGPDSRIRPAVDPATAAARESALSKLTDEERKALGL